MRLAGALAPVLSLRVLAGTLLIGTVLAGTLLATALLATNVWASGDRPAGKSEFWQQREASYRESARGPFTAIHAWYLGYTGEANIYVVGDSLAAEPVGRGAGLRVNFAAPGFLISAVKAKGFDYAVMSDEAVRDAWFVGKEAGDSLNIQVGRFLVSLGMQDSKTGRVLIYDPDLLAGFHGFPVFEDRNKYRVRATITPGDREEVELGTSRGLTKSMVRAATIRFRLNGEKCQLSGFHSADEEDPNAAYFVPFRDQSSGVETYGVGRYLQVVPQDDGGAVIDFNHATNPWCAYSEFYNCILPPQENELAVSVLAGERAPEPGVHP